MKMGDYKFHAEKITIKYEGKQIFGRLYKPQTKAMCPAVILSHGYNGTGADFEKECEYFASNGIIALAHDFCGGSVNSKSSGASVDMTVFTEKSDLMAVLDYVKGRTDVETDHIFLLGASQGGFVTSLTAVERREEIRGIILYFPALCIPDDWRKRFPKAEEIPETLEFWGLELGRIFFETIHNMYPYEEIGRFEKEVLIVQGDEDPVVPLSYAVRARDTYANAELIVFPGEGHGFSTEKNAEAANAALRFMKRNCGQ